MAAHPGRRSHRISHDRIRSAHEAHQPLFTRPRRQYRTHLQHHPRIFHLWRIRKNVTLILHRRRHHDTRRSSQRDPQDQTAP